MIEVVRTCWKMTTGTCLQADNGFGTTRKKKIKDKADGCCEQRPENGGTGKEDGG